MLQLIHTTFLLIYCCSDAYGAAEYGNVLPYFQQPEYANAHHQYNRNRQLINHRYHPTTYSKESSEEKDAAASMASPQIQAVQYAYQGGDVFQPQDFQQLQLHQGEVLNHIPPQAAIPGPGSVTPRPHPVHQQLQINSQQQAAPQPPVSILPVLPGQFTESIPHIQEVQYNPHDGYSDHDSEHDHEFSGYHYGYPVHPPPPPRPPLTPRPPPQKSKASQSAFAYYYIGRHLWYIPLYFSIYFIAYVGLLVLKSIARHKVLLPALSQEAAHNRQYHVNYALRSIEVGKQKYYMK